MINNKKCSICKERIYNNPTNTKTIHDECKNKERIENEYNKKKCQKRLNEKEQHRKEYETIFKRK